MVNVNVQLIKSESTVVVLKNGIIVDEWYPAEFEESLESMYLDRLNALLFQEE